MASIVQSGYPGYSAVNNYSSQHNAVKSSGRVTNTEQHDAAIALEKSGRLNLSQFGFINLPREVLFLQDERDVKVKATRLGDQVQSSSKSDLDEERSLKNLEGGEDENSQRVDPIKPRKERTSADGREVKKDAAGLVQDNDEQQANTKKLDVRDVSKKDINQKDVAAFAEQIKRAAPSENRETNAPRRSEDRRRAQTEHSKTDSAPRYSVVGSPSHVYRSVQATAEGDSSGQNLSVLA